MTDLLDTDKATSPAAQEFMNGFLVDSPIEETLLMAGPFPPVEQNRGRSLTPDEAPPRRTQPPTPTRAVVMVLLWLGAMLTGSALVAYGFGPVFEARAQRHLTKTVAADVGRAANESSGLGGVTVATKPPEVGSPVAILEIGAIKLQQATVEGVASSQTRKGPGHVPGTAGLGQPGNSVVVGRAHGYGGVFGGIRHLREGDRILVTTPQGQSVYEVKSRHQVTLKPGLDTDPYSPSKDSRLTLVTSGGSTPWNKSRATVVVASLLGTPFAPTPQGGRSDDQTGTGGESGALASVVLAMALFGACLSASVLLHQRLRLRIAYLLTIFPVLAATIIAGETISRVFPAWM